MCKKLNIIGCGRVGKTLARLLKDANTVSIGSVLNRSPGTAREATSFLGGGEAAASLAYVQPADVWMVSAADDSLAEIANQLCHSDRIGIGNIVFNCSGAIPSSVFAPLRERGAVIGSVHPIKSFANVENSMATFSGTHCGIEGDRAAVDFLTSAISAIHGIPFEIDGTKKLIYHAAAVVSSNYLVALVEVALRFYECAGVPRERALALIEPFMLGTLGNVSRYGTAKALTGPIARGEDHLVADQYNAVRMWDSGMADVYAALGRVAIELSKLQGTARDESLIQIRNVLSC